MQRLLRLVGRRIPPRLSWPPRVRLRRLEAATRQLPRIRELRRLLCLTTRLVVRSVGAGHATVYLEDTSSPGREPLYRLTLSHGPQKPPEITQLTSDSPLIQWLRQHRKPLKATACQPSAASSLRSAARARDNPYGRIHLIVENLRAEAVIPAFLGTRLVGLLILGARRDGGGSYTDEEMEALRHLAEGCAIALENAHSYEQLKTTAQKFHAVQDRMIRQERMVSAGKIAMGLAHEIKNPLAAIKTFTEFLPERYDDPEFRKEFAQVVGKEVDRINHIVQSLSDFAKPLLLKVEPTDVQHILKETTALLSNDCLKRHIGVQQTYDPAPILVPADASRLKEAFLNLCMNALEAMPKGGTLSVSCAYQGSEAIIRIADTGPGIPREHLPVLFEPFFSTKDGGMGLGLSVVKQVVEQHFGSIHIESEPGVGTTFELRLPWAMQFSPAAQTAARSEPSLPASTPLARPLDLLIVDDEPLVRRVLSDHFAVQGCRVRGVARGEEALSLLETDPPQLVLLDLKLEGIDGIETLARLKQRRPSLPVIVISGHIEGDDTERQLRELGAIVCLRKPLNMITLQVHVAEVSSRLSSTRREGQGAAHMPIEHGFKEP